MQIWRNQAWRFLSFYSQINISSTLLLPFLSDQLGDTMDNRKIFYYESIIHGDTQTIRPLPSRATGQ